MLGQPGRAVIHLFVHTVSVWVTGGHQALSPGSHGAGWQQLRDTHHHKYPGEPLSLGLSTLPGCATAHLACWGREDGLPLPGTLNSPVHSHANRRNCRWEVGPQERLKACLLRAQAPGSAGSRFCIKNLTSAA